MEHERNTIADELEQAGKKLEDVQEKLKDATSEIKVQKLKGAAADTGNRTPESRHDRHRCDSQPFQFRKGQTAGDGNSGTEKG